MNTIYAYAKNDAKYTGVGTTKRRLISQESPHCNRSKKRILSIDNRHYAVSANEDFANIEDGPSSSGTIENDKHENDQRNQQFSNADCTNEVAFVNKLDEFLKLTVEISSLAEVSSNGDFSQLQPSTTQAVSNVSSQLYAGLIEKEKLMLLLEFLLKLHSCETALPKFQEKSRIWAITQLKKLFCVPSSVLLKNEYLHPVTLQIAITKVVGIIANRRQTEPNIPNGVVHILISVSLAALKMTILPHPSLVESILKILCKNKSVLSTSQELLEHINALVIEDKINISSESLEHLWSLHLSSLEDTIVNILVEDKTQSDRRKVTLKLVHACCHNSMLFQQVVNMFITAWLQTGGNGSIADSLSKFVCLVQNASNNNSLLSLFPADLSPLVLLLQIPAEDFSPSMQRLHASSVTEMMSDMISSGLCQEEDIKILFLIFPSWSQVLYNLSTSEPFSSNNILKMLVNAS